MTESSGVPPSKAAKDKLKKKRRKWATSAAPFPAYLKGGQRPKGGLVPEIELRHGAVTEFIRRKMHFRHPIPDEPQNFVKLATR
jgi:hypothetical protein